MIHSLDMRHRVRRDHRESGFTLTEVMVALALGTIIMVGLLSTYILSVKGFKAMADYTVIHAEGRHALDLFASDVRVATGITSTTTTNVVLNLPTAFDSSGVATGSNSITHTFQNSWWTRTDGNAGTTKILSRDVTNLTFSMYDSRGSNTATAASAYEIQAKLQLVQYFGSKTQSETQVSSRMKLRNKP